MLPNRLVDAFAIMLGAVHSSLEAQREKGDV